MPGTVHIIRLVAVIAFCFYFLLQIPRLLLSRFPQKEYFFVGTLAGVVPLFTTSIALDVSVIFDVLTSFHFLASRLFLLVDRFI